MLAHWAYCAQPTLPVPPIWRAMASPDRWKISGVRNIDQFIFRRRWARDLLDGEYPDGDSYATLQLPGALHVNSAQTYEAAALAGLGLIQAPLLGIGRYLESGALVEILPDFRRRPLAVSLVVAHRSNLSRRVRAFMKWIEGVLTPYLE